MPSIPPPRRILVMRYRFIGDTLLTVPFLRNLRRAYPEAKIDVLVGPQSGEVLTHCPYVDELLYFDTTRKHRYENTAAPPKSFGSYVRLLREGRYDTAFVLKRSFSAAALAFLAGIPQRIGFNTEGRGLLLTRRVPYRLGRPEALCFLDVLEAAGVPVTDHHLEAWWSDAETRRAEVLLGEPTPSPRVLLHMTSSNPAKQWTEAHFAALATWLLQAQGATLYALGSATDAEAYTRLQAALPPALQPRLRILCGESNLLESLAFLQRMNLVVGVDSGTLHMAAAVGTPVVALFGPMDEGKWAPPGAKTRCVTASGLSCRPCNLATRCRHDYQCMTDLPLEKVQAACLELLTPS